MIGVMLICSQNERKPRRPVQIEIYSQAPDGTEAWRVAVLSCNPKSDTNVISQGLVTTVLSVPVHPFDKETTKPAQSQKHCDEMDGYVDLDWCFESNRETMQSTRFFVTSCHNPPFDAVLGRPDAKRHGMLNTRRRR
jgi:hypothetical protein